MNVKPIALFFFGFVLAGITYGQPGPFTPEKYLNKEFPLSGLRTLDNQKIGIGNLKGKPTLINFWFTACKPCIEEMPVLNELKSRFLDSVNFIAITYDPRGKVIKFLEKHRFDFTHIADARSFTDKLGMRAYPVNMFLDKDGIVRNVEIGMRYPLDENKQPVAHTAKAFQGILTRLLSD
ncbi:MAG: TlpA family protein disulfide reductase [Bacteroidetes bacterium]|nr:TlpA family protein disulfide reductase [Bacteroidota bacterium]